MVDFESIKATARARLLGLLQSWLSNGIRRGHEYVVGDLRNAKGESLSINLKTGAWKDFATGQCGGDPISLYAALRGLSQLDSATALAEQFGLGEAPHKSNGKANGKSHKSSAHPDAEAEIIMPVPAKAPPPNDHFRLGKPTKRWAYRDAAGAIIGYAVRFNLPDAKKEVIPQVFTSRGWQWKSFPKPRPLYGLGHLAARPDAPVVICEGEPAADAAAKLLPEYVSVTWPGGGQATQYVDWTVLHGRKVLIWPDRDRHDYKDGMMAGEEIPYEEQPGTVTGNEISDILGPHCPEVKILDTRDFTKPGHDAADCEAKIEKGGLGWDTAEFLNWARKNVRTWQSGVAAPQSAVALTIFKPIPTHLRQTFHLKDLTTISTAFLNQVYIGTNGPLKHYSGEWYRWNGSHYPKVEMELIRRDAYAFLNQCAYFVDKGGIEDIKPDRELVSKLIDAMAALVHLEATQIAPCWISGRGPDPKGCAVLQNGVLELSTRRLWNHTPDFWTHNCVPYSYDPLLPPPVQWLAFLDSTWPTDTAAIACLQEIFGYVLTSDTSLQKIFMIVGPKRSGKGTIGRVLKALLGKENTCEPTLDSLRNEFGLEQLIGKMLAVFSDVRLEGQTASITEHLLSISGEDSKSVNRKNVKHWNGQLISRFVMLTNILPRFGDSSGALASRFIILQMVVSHFGKEDPKLTEKLLQELPGIFNWSLDGLDRLRARGHFVIPASSQDKIREFEELSAPIAAFIRDSCMVGDTQQIECSELYEAWIKWCRDNGRDGHGTLQSFSRDLKAQEPMVVTKPLRTWSGVRPHFVGITKSIGSNLKEEEAAAVDMPPAPPPADGPMWERSDFDLG